VEIRRLRAGEGERLRELRLRALRDAPDAFAESLDTAQAAGAPYWDAFADASEAASERVTMIAVEDGRWLGMGAAFLEPERADIVGVVAMWVDPSARGARVGHRLLDALLDWGRARGAARAELWVTEGNARAEAGYRSYGFEPTSRRWPRRDKPGLAWAQMTRAI